MYLVVCVWVVSLYMRAHLCMCVYGGGDILIIDMIQLTLQVSLTALECLLLIPPS
jgi:hypothetical protein